MESTQISPFEAATKGCVNSLQRLLIIDPLILERPFFNHFNESLLHVSAILGHIDFVKKIIEINPQLVCEVNLQKHNPLHLAAAKGHVEVVKALLSVDDDRVTCLARDRNGLTPVHLAAIKGQDEAVKLLLEAQPDAARMLVYEDQQTILHLCVKNYQIEALKLILATVNEADREFVNSKDAHGNTALHLAVADKQVETRNVLVSMGAVGSVEVNAQNQDGLIGDSEIVESPTHAGGGVVSETSINNKNNSSPNIASCRGDRRRPDNIEMTSRKRDALFVVSTVVAGMMFQIGTNPPGGVWQDDNFLMDSEGNYVDPQGRRVLHPVDSQNNTVPYPHQAGHSVMARNDPLSYKLFHINNGLGFFTFLCVILILLKKWRMSNELWRCILSMCVKSVFATVLYSYVIAVLVITPMKPVASNHNSLRLVSFLPVCCSIMYFSFCYGLILKWIIEQLPVWWTSARWITVAASAGPAHV